MARWFVNPRRRRRKGLGRQHRPRVRVGAHTFTLGLRSPYKGRIHRVNPIIRNPFIREVGMYGLNPHRRRRYRYRRNPIIRNPTGALSLGGIMRNPLGVVSNGFAAVAGAFLTNSIPNMFGLFAGPDMVSKLLRGTVRVVVGGFVYGAARSFLPQQAPAVAVGAAMGSIGATVLDLLNTRLVLGYGDVTQTPGMLLAGVGTIFGGSPTGYMGVGAYTRPMGAYTRPMGAFRTGFSGIYGSNSMGMTRVGDSIY
ncbi:MAG: hypothetical protein L0214_13245 [candidate division NC10 bacterium]|nr:hypothetical protein [candidate division NC10 bacterium]